MASDEVLRRLAAILSADAVGYSRLVANDEVATVRLLEQHRDQIAKLVRQYRGRVVDSPGDNVLAEFGSVVDAVRSAVAIQAVVGEVNADLPADRRLEFRIGVHLGEVMVEGKRIYGNGVNIAARLEGLAAPGGICVSGAVHEQVHDKLAIGFDDLGAQTVKNIPTPVHVYAVRGDARSDRGLRHKRAKRIGLRRALLVIAGVAAFLVVALVLSWPRPLGLIIDQVGLGSLPEKPPLPDRPSIVVLPFVNLSADPEDEYFSDGMTEDLTTELSHHPGLFVISRSSAFTYKGRNVRAEDVGRELGVRYVIEGSVRRSQDTLRITAQLIDATTGFHVWSERYDRKLTDIFVLQAELAEKILIEVGAVIRDAEQRRSARSQTNDLNAYDAFLRGLFRFGRFTRDDNEEARKLFTRAVEIDPGFASAYALLGNTYAVEYALGWSREPALLTRAEDSARRALELDSRNANAYIVLGNVYNARRQWERAIEATDRAIEISPNFDVSHMVRGIAFTGQGHPLRALESLNLAVRLNPRGTSTTPAILGLVNYRAGRIEKAVELWESARAANPDLLVVQALLAAHYESVGRHEEARTTVEAILRVNPRMTASAAAEMTSATGTVAENRSLLARAGLPDE